MSLYFDERVKDQESDDRASDKNVVFTFPWIIDFSIDNEDVINNEEAAAAETSFATSYKMASTYWKASLRNDYTNIVVKNIAHENWDGICFISYTLYYDDEMRFEFFSSTRIQMIETLDEHGIGKLFETPEGYMERFTEGADDNNFLKCVISVELHLPSKYFYQPSFKRYYKYLNEIDISHQIPDDYENDYRFKFLKKGDFTFECLDGTVLAGRNMLFTSNETMKRQLSSQTHQSVVTALYTVDVIKPIITFFHSHIFKLPDSYNFEYIDRLLHAIEFFECGYQKDMLKKLQELLCLKLAKENHDFNSVLEWLSFSSTYRIFRFGLTSSICSLIANEYYFQWQETFPITARNMENRLYRQLFERAEAARNAENHFFRQLLEKYWIHNVLAYIDFIFTESFLTNVILQ